MEKEPDELPEYPRTGSGTDHERWITTTDSFEEYRIEAYLGTVSGTGSYLTNGQMLGGVKDQGKLFDKWFTEAKNVLWTQALARGGNAVVGMRFEVITPGSGSGSLAVIALIGTAVRLETTS